GETGAWDEEIRERGYILKENDGYHLWYTGFKKNTGGILKTGYATSADGINWIRFAGNPIIKEPWTEDMMVVKKDSLYYMFAEGQGDTAHMLSSSDKIHWKEHGPLQIRYTNGQPIERGPYGTPTVFIENDTFYLFYERNDSAIWLASSKNLELWTNVQDKPVIKKGPQSYDIFGVALNQVIKYRGLYYGYYHGTALADWSEWSTNIAVSSDMKKWKKFNGNPIIKNNRSSGILINDENGFRLYTMHPEINLHFSSK
ncbi:MAG: glycosylase, partial [Chitinophagaceae bacterium]